MLKLKMREKPFLELSYANPRQPALTRWVIHSIEGLSGRDRYTALYDFWRRQVVPTGERVFSRMLELIDVRVRTADQWPPAQLPDTPLVIVANHPFGIGDGIAGNALVSGIARQPEAQGRLFTPFFITVGLVEAAYFINLAFMALFVFATPVK